MNQDYDRFPLEACLTLAAVLACLGFFGLVFL